MLSVPLFRGLVLLNLFLPGMFWLAFVVARRVFPDRTTARVAAFGVGLGLWLLPVHLIARFTGGLQPTLAAVTVTLGALGYWLLVREWRSGMRFELRLGLLPKGLLLFSAVTTLFVGLIAWRWAFHDEISINGHHAIVASIQNWYPPPNLTFPWVELQYHYGFNLLCAIVTGLFRVTITAAIDLVTIVLWAYSTVVLWALGERIVGKRYGTIFAALALLGGGVPLTCTVPGVTLPWGTYFLGFCFQGGMLQNPPVVSYFFQHPWTLGLPIASCALLIQSEDESPAPELRLVCLVALLGVLYISQVALFAATTAAIMASELFDERRRPLLARLTSLAIIATTAVTLVLLAGGFAVGSSGPKSAFVLHAGIADTPKNSLLWTLYTFGGLLLGAVGAWLLPRRRALCAALGIGGVVLINVVQYRETWDIVKFATVSSVGLALGLTGLLRWLRLVLPRIVGAVVPVALSMASLYPGVVFLGALGFKLEGIPVMYLQVPREMAKDDRRVASYLRRKMPPKTVMYRAHAFSHPYANYAGLPQVWMDNAFPINAKLGPSRVQVMSTLPEDTRPYLLERMRFFVLGPNEGKLETNMQLWLKNGLAIHHGNFGALRVYELKER